MPLANGLLTAEQLEQPEAKYPLNLAFCPACALVQITETVPPETIFSDYPYLSSFSQANVDSARENVAAILASRDLGKDSLAIEVGSNDGYLLQFYKEKGIPVLGIDPAENIVGVARERGIPTCCAYFDYNVAGDVAAMGGADVIHLNNTFAHLSGLNGVVAGLELALKDDGVIVIQVPYVKDMIERVEFPTIYHEHLCYFSVTALENLFRRHGLYIADVHLITIHGGTLRLFVRKEGERTGVADWRFTRAIEDELRLGMDKAAFYLDFASKVKLLREKLRALLCVLKARGKSIAGYAASASGAILLNYCDIGKDTLDFIVDRSTAKQGRYAPGTHLPICPPVRLLDEMPEYALLLAWNHADEILGREIGYVRRGGRFICPVPEPSVLQCGSDPAWR